MNIANPDVKICRNECAFK